MGDWADIGTQLNLNFDDGDQPEVCPFAASFREWVKPHLEEVRANPLHETINQKMLIITRKYREWRGKVPRAHRHRVSDAGHVCVFHIWDEALLILEALELSLTPPQLYLPEPARPTRRKREEMALPEPPAAELWGGGIIGLKATE